MDNRDLRLRDLNLWFLVNKNSREGTNTKLQMSLNSQIGFGSGSICTENDHLKAERKISDAFLGY